MKKILLFVILAISVNVAQGQIVKSQMNQFETLNGEYSEYHPPVWLDFGIGTITGDPEDTGIGLDLGLRWTYMFTENIGWDIVKISAQTDTKSFVEALNVQGKTGIRGVSPVLFGNSSLYANFGCGYGYYTDIEEGGFVWEIGAGVNVTPRFSIGLNYNSADYSVELYHSDKQDVSAGLFSLRLSYGF